MHGRRAALHRRHRAHLRPDPEAHARGEPWIRRCGAAAATIARASIAATFDRTWTFTGDAWRVALPCTDARAIGPCRRVCAAGRVAAGSDVAALARSDRDGAAPWCDPWLAARGHGRPGRSDSVVDAAEDQAWCGQRAVASPQCAPRGRGRAQPSGLVRPAGPGHLARADTAPPNMGPADAGPSNSGRCAATARRRVMGIALCRCSSDADL